MTPKKAFQTALKVILAGGLIYWMISSGRFEFRKLAPLFDVSFLITGLLLVFLSILALSERWRVLLRSQGFELSRTMTARLTLIGIFFNFAMPGGVGGDLVKGYYVVRSHPERKLKAGMTILMDRVFGLYVIVLMAAASLLLDMDHMWGGEKLKLISTFIIGLFVAYTLGLIAGFSSGLHARFSSLLPAKLKSLWDALVSYGHDKTALLKVFAISLLAQLIFLLFYILAGRQMGFTEVPLIYYAVCCLIGTMVTGVPISPAGIGVGQAAFAFLFVALAGKSLATLGAGLASAAQIFQFLWGLVGAYFYVSRRV